MPLPARVLSQPKGDRDEAIKTLEALLARHPEYRDAELLLGDLTRKKSP
jgi:hypothetical protein